MKFKLEPGKLCVYGIEQKERRRLACIDLAICRAVISLLHNPLVDGATSFEFAPEKTETVRTVLAGFQETV